VANVEINKRIVMMTRATTMTLIMITSIDMTIIIMMITRVMTMLPTQNNDVDGNVNDAYANREFKI